MFQHTSLFEVYYSFLGVIQSVVYPFLVFYPCTVPASTSGGHKMQLAAERIKVKGRVWSQRIPFKCEETVLCGISMHFLIYSSVCLLLPVTPTATITCHPSRHLRFLIVHPPSALFSLPSLLVTCHPLHSLLLALLSWFPRYSSSHFTSFRSSVRSLALPQWRCCGDR